MVDDSKLYSKETSEDDDPVEAIPDHKIYSGDNDGFQYGGGSDDTRYGGDNLTKEIDDLEEDEDYDKRRVRGSNNVHCRGGRCSEKLFYTGGMGILLRK